MKRRRNAKLTLSRETLRLLSDAQLGEVRGGNESSGSTRSENCDTYRTCSDSCMISICIVC